MVKGQGRPAFTELLCVSTRRYRQHPTVRDPSPDPVRVRGAVRRGLPDTRAIDSLS